MDKPNIKILVSCHKDIVAPQSEVFLPVHVGAAGSQSPLKGMQPDDEGNNISERNFTYCELTAQYWAWKNLEADYYGLCHYRRYFYFGDKKYRANDHKQIELEELSPFTIKEFQLDDADLIRSIVCQHDAVTPPYWNVKGAPTPCGPKKTIQEHMMGYGLIDQQGFDLLYQVVSEVQPAYSDDLRSYLNGNKYLGYNCYILKKDLFFALCDFEFSILFEFDKRFDYSNRTVTQKRVCGYLGEILYSVFINHIKKQNKYSIAQYPMVFFEDTRPLFSLPNEPGASEERIEIVWRYEYKTPWALLTGLTSLIKHMDPARLYTVNLLCKCDFKYDAVKQHLSSIPANVCIKQTTWQNADLSHLGVDIASDELRDLYPYLLPWIGDCTSRVLWIDGLAVFNDDPAKIVAKLDANQRAIFACCNSMITEREMNRPQNVPVANTYKQYIQQACKLSSSVTVVDCLRARSRFSVKEIVEQYRAIYTAFDAFKRPKHKYARFPMELPASCLAADSALMETLRAIPLTFDEATQSANREEMRIWANSEHIGQWENSGQAIVISYRPENLPYLFPEAIFGDIFWSAAKETSAYESILLTMSQLRQNHLLDLILPQGSFGRRALRKLAFLVRR